MKSHKSQGSDKELTILFHRTSKILARFYHSHNQTHHTQKRVLTLIQEHGPMSQSTLLEMLDVRSSSLSEILGKLEKKQLIVRTPNEADRRGYIVQTTQTASELLSHQQTLHNEQREELFACLSDEEKLHLITLLDKLVTSLEGQAPYHETDMGRKRCKGRQREGERLREAPRSKKSRTE